MQTHESYESAMQKKSWRSGGQNKKLPKDLVIWLQQTTKFSLKIKGWDFVTNMQELCKTCSTQLNSTSSMQNRISTEDDEKSRKFLHSEEYLRSIYTDKCLEFVYSLRRAWHGTMKDLAERAKRRVKEGTLSVLVQYGLQESWCADAVEY